MASNWTQYRGKPSVTIYTSHKGTTASFNADALRVLGAKRKDAFNVAVYFKGYKCMVVRDDDGYLRITSNGTARGYAWTGAGWPVSNGTKYVATVSEFDGKPALVLSRPKKSALTKEAGGGQ